MQKRKKKEIKTDLQSTPKTLVHPWEHLLITDTLGGFYTARNVF